MHVLQDRLQIVKGDFLNKFVLVTVFERMLALCDLWKHLRYDRKFVQVFFQRQQFTWPQFIEWHKRNELKRPMQVL
jgi:hypothetical protein